MNIVRHIPNIITLSNLFCGILAVEQAFQFHFFSAGALIILGATFDFFDGFSARLLKVSNNIGKELDSLADLITFGLAPGVIMFRFIQKLMDLEGVSDAPFYLPYFAFLITLLSAVRLARFNVDENQSDKFIGLPTPANSIFFLSLPLIFEHHLSEISASILLPVVLLLILVFSLLLNAKIELLALKFKSYRWHENSIRFSFVIASVFILIICTFWGYFFISIPSIILLYLTLSILNNYHEKI